MIPRRTFLILAAIAAFFIAGCGNVRSGESDWRAGQIMAAAFLCSAVDPIVRYAKAEPAGVEKILRVFLRQGSAAQFPQEWACILKSMS